MKTKQTKQQIIDDLVSNGISLIRIAKDEDDKNQYLRNYISSIYTSMRPGQWHDHRITKKIADEVAKRLSTLSVNEWPLK